MNQQQEFEFQTDQDFFQQFKQKGKTIVQQTGTTIEPNVQQTGKKKPQVVKPKKRRPKTNRLLTPLETIVQQLQQQVKTPRRQSSSLLTKPLDVDNRKKSLPKMSPRKHQSTPLFPLDRQSLPFLTLLQQNPSLSLRPLQESTGRRKSLAPLQVKKR